MIVTTITCHALLITIYIVLIADFLDIVAIVIVAVKYLDSPIYIDTFEFRVITIVIDNSSLVAEPTSS